MRNSEKIQRVESSLIKLLEELFPPLEYKQGDSLQTFNTEAVFRAGQRDVIKRLKLIKQQQDKPRR